MPDAVIVAKRLDMAPDSMPTMTKPLSCRRRPSPASIGSSELTMQAGWQLSLGAKVQGETGTVESKLVIKADPMTRVGCVVLTLAALAAAGAGGYWAEIRHPGPTELTARIRVSSGGCGNAPSRPVPAAR